MLFLVCSIVQVSVDFSHSDYTQPEDAHTPTHKSDVFVKITKNEIVHRH